MSGVEPGPEREEDQVQLARARQVALIGERIRALRRERMKLSQLAQASKVSIGLLSRLENGVGNPAFASLSAIARALEVDVHSFFETPDDESVVLTEQDRIRLEVPRNGVTLELLVPSFHSRIAGLLMTLSPGYAPARLASARPAQLFETVLGGSVEYRIEDEIHQLENGDSIMFEASRPHLRRNTSGSRKATILTCSQEFQLESYFPPES